MSGAALIVRPQGSGEAKAVRAVVEAAFGASAEADLVDDLTAAGDSEISVVAEAAGAIVGHVLFSRMSAPFRVLALAPVSVVPERQGGGIGAAIVRSGIERAQTAGWEGIFVLGAPAYYRRFGFDPKLAAGFTSPYAGPHFMALALCAPALPAGSGELRHAPAFTALDGRG